MVKSCSLRQALEEDKPLPYQAGTDCFVRFDASELVETAKWRGAPA